MVNTSQWAEAVRKLILRTAEGPLQWNATFYSKELREDVLGDGIYLANVQGRSLIVYEYRYKSYSDEEHYVWEQGVTIEFVDHEGCLQWAWPKTPYHFQLLDTIRYQLARADKFLEDFLP